MMKYLTNEKADPKIKLPEEKTIFCKPAGSGLPAMVHTIVRPAAVKVHDAASTAEPDTGTSVPVGDAAPVK